MSVEQRANMIHEEQNKGPFWAMGYSCDSNKTYGVYTKVTGFEQLESGQETAAAQQQITRVILAAG